jgi:hypothetical protein
MRFIAAVVLVLISNVALAEESAADRACVMLSAAQVPSIAGMQIKSATVRTGTPQMVKADPSWRIVEVEVSAVGRDVTFVYDCTLKGGRPKASPAGMK